MKIEVYKIHKTATTVSLVPNLYPSRQGTQKHVGFYVRGTYYDPQEARNLYNRDSPTLPPTLPTAPKNRILQDDFPIGDIPCYVIDRGVDIEIIVE